VNHNLSFKTPCLDYLKELEKYYVYVNVDFYSLTFFLYSLRKICMDSSKCSGFELKGRSGGRGAPLSLKNTGFVGYELFKLAAHSFTVKSNGFSKQVM
jgi:hypothetical protein